MTFDQFDLENIRKSVGDLVAALDMAQSRAARVDDYDLAEPGLVMEQLAGTLALCGNAAAHIAERLDGLIAKAA